ncbi:MAG: holo-ACP synthase [Bacilli bacterium]|nr:holo-ACP synthase [Bacilli bacterium]
MIIGIGIDIVQNNRIKLEQARRILSEVETERFGILSTDSRKLEYLAGRFAVKEAIIKAIGNTSHQLGMRDLTILNDEKGMPFLHSPKLENILIHISISHEKEYSVGFCVLENV